MNIKNLADFRKALVGATLEIVENGFTTEDGRWCDFSKNDLYEINADGVLVVERTTSQRIYLTNSYGQSTFIEFGSTNDWSFDGDLATTKGASRGARMTLKIKKVGA